MSMTGRITVGGLRIAGELYDFVANEAVAGTGVDVGRFWSEFASIVADLAPKNRALLQKRDAIQEKIDAWHRQNGAPNGLLPYEAFLRSIDYIVPEGPGFKVTTRNVDDEIAKIAGPQLVVPVMNARYALNAANARWGLAL